MVVLKYACVEGCELTKGTEHSACWDLRAYFEACTPGAVILDRGGDDVSIVRTIRCGSVTVIRTGVTVEIPQGYIGNIYMRSGLSTKNGLCIPGGVSVIDSDFRGELSIPLTLVNSTFMPFNIKVFDRIAQFTIVKLPDVELQKVVLGELSKTRRGGEGYGSTGI